MANQAYIVRRGGGGTSLDLQSINILSNGNYQASALSVDGWDEITVSVPMSFTSVDLSVSSNGTYAPSDYNVEAFGNVTVDVQYATSALNVTTNGTYYASNYSVNGFSEVNVTVGGEDNLVKYAAKTLEIVNDASGYFSQIQPYQFSGQSMLSEVYMPSCSIIYAGAFYGCSNLETIRLQSGCSIAFLGNQTGQSGNQTPSTISLVATSVFYGCYKLKNLTSLNWQSDTIQDYTFAYCSALSEITIPSTVTKIRRTAFIECKGLKTINCEASSSIYIYDFAFKNAGVDENTFSIDVLNKLVLTNTSNYYYGQHFAGTSFTILSFDANFMSAYSLGMSAWQSCSLLSIVNMSYNTYLANGCFADCSALREVIIPKCIVAYGGYITSGFSGGLSISAPLLTSPSSAANLTCVSKLKLPGCTTMATYCGISMDYANFDREIYFDNLSILYKGSNIKISASSYNTLISFGALNKISVKSAIYLTKNAYIKPINIVIDTSSVCTMAAASGIRINYSTMLNIYVPTSLVDSYKAATNWIAYSSLIRDITSLSIYFNYKSSTYYTTWGTTWADFIESGDNTAGFYISDSLVYDSSGYQLVNITDASSITKQDFEYTSHYIEIDGTRYQAVANQLWYQWLVDGHNIDGYKQSGGYLSTYIYNSNSSLVYTANDEPVNYFDTLVMSSSYHTSA